MGASAAAFIVRHWNLVHDPFKIYSGEKIRIHNEKHYFLHFQEFFCEWGKFVDVIGFVRRKVHILLQIGGAVV